MPRSSGLQKCLPWTQAPLICNGPMLGVSSPAMATQVSLAGGLGFLASIYDLDKGSSHLRKLDEDLSESRRLIAPSSPSSASRATALRVGISFITGHASVDCFSETALPLIVKHSPAAVWLFAPSEQAKGHGAIITALRSLDRLPSVFVQVGNVAAAREATHQGADVLVCQGIDAGGHQFRAGAGVVSLLPEVRAMLDQEFPGNQISLLAAGGIVNGDGVAAMLALGAQGVVMGTRFCVAEESVYPDHRKKLLLETADAAVSKIKSSFHDQMSGTSLWGPLYDGRAVIGPIHRSFLSGSSVDECQKMLKEKYSPEQVTAMVSTWAGTGVGLVNKPQPAAAIVAEVREGAKERIRELAGLV